MSFAINAIACALADDFMLIHAVRSYQANQIKKCLVNKSSDALTDFFVTTHHHANSLV